MERLLKQNDIINTFIKTTLIPMDKVQEEVFKKGLEDILNDVPAVESNTGHWTSITIGNDEYFKCSNCREVLEHPYEQHNFCPNCGADMR